MAFAACSDSDDSMWATKANDLCTGFAGSWSSLAPNDVDDAYKERLRSDLRELAEELAALDGAGSDAREAVDGMETFVAAWDSGDVPTDIEWISAFRDAGAESCWRVFQGSPSIPD